MASIAVKRIGRAKVHFRPAGEFDIVEVVFIDARGGKHRSKFALSDLIDSLSSLGNTEVVVDSVSTKADQVDLVR